MKAVYPLIIAFVFGLVVGSILVPHPRYRSDRTGFVLDTWTGKLDTYADQRKAEGNPLPPLPSN